MDIFEKCHRYTEAKAIQASGCYPYFIAVSDSDGTEVEIDGHRLVMAGSNNYLGLTHHPYVLEAAQAALARYGTSCSGSRFLNGTLELHEELERRLAKFLNRDAAICFSTGFQTNLGTISAICGKDDIIFCDRENHASLFDGARLTLSEMRRFRHNDMEDLERKLAAADPKAGKIVIVDGLYSMMGDIPDLAKLVQIAKSFGARVMVDEAHSIGVLGDNGRGAAELCKVESEVDLITGTFSKSFASLGGFVSGPEDVIHYIKHNARALMFSASITPSSTAAALAALDLIESQPELRAQVMHNANRVRTGLRAQGIDTGHENHTPIVPVIVGERMKTFGFWRALFENGLYTNPVTAPAVPPGQDLIRTSYMATHTEAQIDRVLDIFAQTAAATDLFQRDSVRAREA